MRRFRLAPVLRARLAQEDVAKAEVVRTRGKARYAERVAARRERDLNSAALPEGAPAHAIVAALVARRSLAADLSAARQDIQVAEQEVDSRLADLAEAAKRRRVVEKLGERHAARQRALAEAADQRAIDEVAVTAATRKGVLA